jgi:hypothetical protein
MEVGMRRQDWWVACCAVAGAVSSLTAIGPTNAAEPRAAFQNELVVYDAGTNERGLAEISLLQTEEGTQVDVSRALHVHRTYYTGDKEFQFKLIQGGPSTVVANHPRTGEKLYIDVDLPAGIPIIAYNQHSITYVFPDRRVCIHFPRYGLKPTVTVVNVKGHGVVRTALEHHQRAVARRQVHLANSPLVGAIRDVGTSTKNVVVGTVGFAGQTGATVINGARTTVENLPLIAQARQSAENRAEEGSRVAINRATKVAEQADRQFVPTNR